MLAREEKTARREIARLKLAKRLGGELRPLGEEFKLPYELVDELVML